MDNGIRIISDREQKEYLPDCPAQVIHNTITEDKKRRLLQVTLVPCTASAELTVHITVFFTDARRVEVGRLEADLSVQKTDLLECPDTAVYAYTRLEAVFDAGTEIWTRDGREPVQLPEQAVLWQTDPLYEQIRRECDGIVTPFFRPDRIDGIWRCTCGQINLANTPRCGRCKTELAWLDSHFDTAYLTEQDRLYREEAAKHPKTRKKPASARSKEDTVRRQMIALLAGILSALVLVVLLVTLIIPSVRYAIAEKHMTDGNYTKAAEIFDGLDGFRDAAERMEDAIYKEAQVLTGLTDVYMVTTAEYPCYTITEDGTLSFRKDDYTGDWSHFQVPDMVDGIIVRTLADNFFLNCKEMISVTLSDCLEELQESTFLNCISLRTVHFGKNIRTLGPRTFINCTALTEISIPDTVTKIGLRCFNSCTSLRRVHLGSGITKVPSYLFSCCSDLEEVSFGAAVTSIDAFAFAECDSLKTVRYPGTEADWKGVTVAEENQALEQAEILFVK